MSSHGLLDQLPKRMNNKPGRPAPNRPNHPRPAAALEPLEHRLLLSVDAVFFGDSITAKGNWSDLLELNNIENQGMAGNTTADMLARIGTAVADQPAKLFLMGGVNDILQGVDTATTEANYQQIDAAIQTQSPGTVIYLQSILPVDNSVWTFGFIDSQKIVELNSKLRSLADGTKIQFVDLYPLFAGSDGVTMRSDYAIDGVHPNSTGYQIWTDAIRGEFPPATTAPYPGPNPAALPGKLELENFDRGGQGVAYHDLTSANSGGQYRPMARVDSERCSDTGGGYDVGWNQPGEWLNYTVNVATAGAYDLDIRAAYGGTNASGGTVHLECDGAAVSGPIALPKTGGWQNWQTVSTTGVNLAAGQHVLKLVMDKDGAGSIADTAYLANLNWVSLNLPAAPGPTGHLDDPRNGASIDASTLNARKWIDITYSSPNRLDLGSITDAAPEFTLSGAGAAGVVIDATPTAYPRSSTYRYGFTGSFGTGPVTVSFIAGSFADAMGNVNPADSKRFTVTGAAAVPQSPYPGPNPASVPAIVELENFDKGGEGVAYRDLNAANTGNQYRTSDGIDIEKCSEGGYDVGWNQPGEWLEYTVNVPSAGVYELDLRAAYGGANATGGTVHLQSDGKDLTGPITLPKTGGWQAWQTIRRKGIALSAGQHVLKLVMDKDGAGSTADTAYLANLNWMKLSPASTLPAPWISADVGGVGKPGSVAFSSGVYTVQASGADIWGTSDAFRFVYQSLSGNGTIIARVDSITNTDPWAKAGVMIRETLAANARNAYMAISPTSGLAFQGRSTIGGNSTGTWGGAGSAPYWLKLVRIGSSFTGYKSTDGSTWTQVGSAMTISMNSTVYIGLASTGHNNATLGTSVFSDVQVG